MAIDFVCCIIEDLKRGNKPNPICKNGMLCAYKN